MDKLREILVYRFWMLLAIALIVPLVGWWIGSGDAASAISARKNEINAAYQAIPKGELINDTWINGVKKINTEQQDLIDAAWEKLAEGQISLKTWPPVIANSMAKLGPDEEIPLDLRDIYFSGAYHREWAEVWLIVNPIRFGKLDLETDKQPILGIVDFSVESLPVEKWGDIAPTTKQMREAQQDIWLYRSLLEAIADVNDGVENRSDAVITKIKYLELLGGLAHKEELDKFEGSKTTEPPAKDAADDEVKRDKKGRAKNKGGVTRSSGISGFIDDSPAMAENFFLDAVELARASGAEVDLFADEADDDAEIKPTEVRRYVQELDQYNTRAFNMVVEMDHRRMPDLLASLSDSPWPIKILRVELTNGTNSKRGGGSKKGRELDEDENDNIFMGSTGQFQANSRPYEAQVEITGTMRIFKSINQAPNTSADEQQPGIVADGSTTDSQPNDVAAANPSFRSAEFEDIELLRNVTDQMKQAEGQYSFGGSRRGRNRPGANGRGTGNGLLRIGDGKGER
ncbi:hypothetical protein CA54_39160 [Symmachiella macrocystis]|uniref:Uncharacterized protein n=1 Tax=Symmachiella macrocystis TaxID=2527985 RepID=A0A5C6B9P5_9PLAN|nr:hypothetical protein [Symmachiella macrocystis]TWU08680.1 hypothetical protein CA54_39160 [Symmachiella macrocystis]